jgi:hypothetical protein
LKIQVRERDLRQLSPYNTTEVRALTKLVIRAVIAFKRDFRASYLRDPKFADRVVVSEILPQKVSVGEFPGNGSWKVNEESRFPLEWLLC